MIKLNLKYNLMHNNFKYSTDAILNKNLLRIKALTKSLITLKIAVIDGQFLSSPKLLHLMKTPIFCLHVPSISSAVKALVKHLSRNFYAFHPGSLRTHKSTHRAENCLTKTSAKNTLKAATTSAAHSQKHKGPLPK